MKHPPSSSDSENELKSRVRTRDPLELQKYRLEKLMQDPEKPVKIPEPKAIRDMKPPPEINHNVQGIQFI